MVLCHSMNAGRVLRAFRGGGDTQTLPAFEHFVVGMLEHCFHAHSSPHTRSFTRATL